MEKRERYKEEGEQKYQVSLTRITRSGPTRLILPQLGLSQVLLKLRIGKKQHFFKKMRQNYPSWNFHGGPMTAQYTIFPNSFCHFLFRIMFNFLILQLTALLCYNQYHLIYATLPIKIQTKVEKILKGSLDLIPSPSPLVKIQIHTCFGGVGRSLAEALAR